MSKDTDHAVAIERERIAKWLDDRAASCRAYIAIEVNLGPNMRQAIMAEGTAHNQAANGIRIGDHWKDGA